jgi:hypothetical protein
MPLLLLLQMMPLPERDLVNGKAAASCLGDLVMTALKRRGKIGSRAAALRWYCEPRTDLIVVSDSSWYDKHTAAGIAQQL